MRKVAPDDVRNGFRDFVNARVEYFDRASEYLANKPHQEHDLTVLSETTLQSTYVAFEGFMSDLLIAYINRDFSQYQANLAARVTSSITDKFGAFAAARSTFTPIKHIKLGDLEALLDPNGWNQTFKNVERMKQRFAELVTPALGARVAAVHDADARLIDAMHAIRNFISHGSTGSKDVMNNALAGISTGPGCINEPLRRVVHKIHSVGSYLKANVGGKPRVKVYMERIRDISVGL